MPTFKSAVVSFHRVTIKVGPYFRATEYEHIMYPTKRAQYEFTTIDSLLAQIEVDANLLGKNIVAHVSMAKGQRKPAGFDAATKSLEYNVEEIIDEPKMNAAFDKHVIDSALAI